MDYKMDVFFIAKPHQWGFRGDPYLWDDMKKYFSETEIPGDVFKFENLIIDAFEDLTGHSFGENENFALEKYAHGGMSSGGIAMKFWKERALTFLSFKYNVLNDRGKDEFDKHFLVDEVVIK